jgi:hypothetical protein
LWGKTFWLLEGAFCYFFMRKYEIRKTKAENKIKVFSILVLDSNPYPKLAERF